ncbi:MAG: putative DNA binding domain-containing protein [Clostridiales Family XIII bacterium]|jgi:ATP-dependent DNA helicase RecG|nr:putative DNA binding domain-containing protein [Clostridiales Family XIII bacterium]
MKRHETIEQLLNAPEGEHYQFKEWKTKDSFTETVKICCALANCGGGKLVVGVSDKRPRQVVGSTAFLQPERVRANLIDKLRVGVDFKLYDYNSKRVLAIEISSRPLGLPVQVDGIAWWYVGDSLVSMPEDVRRSIYAESGHDFSAEICNGATIADLDINAIKVFRQTWATNSGNKRILNMSVKQLLHDCGAVTDEGVTYGALILFGTRKALRKYLPRAEVVFEYRSSETAGPAAQREEFTEGFFSYNDRIWELVNLRNDKQHYQEGLFVFPIYTFNERVVREALLNAITHRDYQLAGSVFVRQYRDRLVVESPGGLPYGITVENILDRQSPRNFLIAQIFQLCGLVERSGQGMNLIYELAVREAKPLPDFSGTDAYFVKLTLSGTILDERMLSLIKKIGDERLDAMTTDDYILLANLFQDKGIGGIKPAKFDHLVELGIVKRTENSIEFANGGMGLLARSANGKTSDCQAIATSDWQSLETGDRKKQIVAFFTNDEKVTSSQLAKYTGLTQGRIRTILQGLVNDGVVVKVGDNRYASYRLNNNGEQSSC